MFVPIPEYPEYSISRDGEVFSSVSGRLLSIRVNSKGYNYFSVDRGNKNILLSRALARVFLDLPSLDSKLEVDHKDGDKSNNSLGNLQVLTQEEHLLKTLNDNGKALRAPNYCETCGRPIDYKANFCREHYKASISSSSISIEDIEYWVREFSWVRAAKELGNVRQWT